MLTNYTYTYVEIPRSSLRLAYNNIRPIDDLHNNSVTLISHPAAFGLPSDNRRVGQQHLRHSALLVSPIIVEPPVRILNVS